MASPAAAVSNVEALNNSSSSIEGRTRRTSVNRFEVEKVEEPTRNQSITDVFKNSESVEDKVPRLPSQNTIGSEQTKTSTGHPSVLKKTVKHYAYDDDFFDLDSAQNTTTSKEKSKYLNQKPLSQEQEPLTGSKKSIDEEEKNASCFQINYDETNEPRSITCNLNNSGADSYRNCIHDFKTIALYQKLIAEFLGTLLLTLYACSIGLPIAEKNVPSLNGCLGGGLTLATLIWCLGSVSGGHFNPAVTIAFLFTGKINPLLTVMYVGSQLAGALSGSYMLKSLAPELVADKFESTVTVIHKDINLGQAYVVELLITFILVLTIFSCVDSRRSDLGGSFPLQIGFAVAVGGLFGGKFTGGSMNPARSFGPALATGLWENHWIYWVGPISGSVLAGLIYQFILTLKCPRKPIPRSGSGSSARV